MTPHNFDYFSNMAGQLAFIELCELCDITEMFTSQVTDLLTNIHGELTGNILLR